MAGETSQISHGGASQRDASRDAGAGSREAGAGRLGQRWLWLAGALAFVCVAVARAPASLVGPALSAAGVSYARLDGVIWRGVVSGLSVNDIYFGDVSFSIEPQRLLLAQLSVRLDADGGAVNGGGRARLSLLAGEAALSDVDAGFDLSSITKYSMFGVPYKGRVTATVRRLVWARGGCRAADGEIWTDMLETSARAFGAEGGVLAGETACAGDNLVLTLTGAGAEGEARISISVSPALTYEFVAEVTPRAADMGQSLEMLGFERDGAALVYDAIGPIRGLGS